MLNTLSQWLDWIQAQHPKNIDLSLDRVQHLASSLRLTHFDCSVVMVAGTNGKGSCVATLQAILLAQDYRVASYTSPHLVHFNERIKLNGHMVDDATLCHAFEVVQHAAAGMALTFFEFTTLAALLIFSHSELDIILLEIGLGGRLDAVNVVEPDVTVITSIDLDHMDYLGDTREAIAAEKAGIIRGGIPIIYGDLDIPQPIIDIAQRKQAPLFQVGRDFNYREGGVHWDWHSEDRTLRGLPKPACLLNNAATALMALHQLPDIPLIPIEVIKQGLQSLQLTGRQQWIHGHPALLLDVGHNPQAMRSLAAQLPRNQRILAVVGMLRDKAHAACLAPLVEHVDEWFLASLTDTPRAGHAEQLQAALLSLSDAVAMHTYPNVATAYEQARKAALPHDVIVVFGSFHTVGAVLDMV